MRIDEFISSANRGYELLIKIIECDKFLSKNYCLQSNEFLVSDPELAAFYATDQDIEPPYQYWTNILEQQEIYYSEIKIALPEKGKAIGAETDKLSTRLMQASQIKVAEKKLPDFMQDVICGNFEMFLYELTFDQSLAPFNANLIRIYREGGFPCGWKGDYPNGEQLVYVHSS